MSSSDVEFLDIRPVRQSSMCDARRLLKLIDHLQEGDASTTRVVDEFAQALVKSIYAQHRGEEDLLWPRAISRAGRGSEAFEAQRRQHRDLYKLVESSETAIRVWRDSRTAHDAKEMSATLSSLFDAAERHSLDEQEYLVPLIQSALDVKQWMRFWELRIAALGPRGSAIVLGSALARCTPREREFLLEVTADRTNRLTAWLREVRYKLWLRRVNSAEKRVRALA